MNRSNFASLGFGVGLRRPHYARILEEHPPDDASPVDWFEVISENFMVEGGRPLEVLEGVRARYPVVMHGVSMSIGSTDPLNRDYLRALRALARRVEPAWISDHLCWTGVGGRNLHDLLPLPYTEEAVRHVAAPDPRGAGLPRAPDPDRERVELHGVSRTRRLTEWEFLAAVAESADCGILLDINNIFVSAFNHRFDARALHRRDPRRARRAVPSRRAIAITAASCSTPTTIRSRRGVGALRARGAALRRASRP